jgi:hypothetical protein
MIFKVINTQLNRVKPRLPYKNCSQNVFLNANMAQVKRHCPFDGELLTFCSLKYRNPSFLAFLSTAGTKRFSQARPFICPFWTKLRKHP